MKKLLIQEIQQLCPELNSQRKGLERATVPILEIFLMNLQKNA